MSGKAKNETLADVLAETRDFAEKRDYDSDGNVSTTMLRVYADRIEAAHRREQKKLQRECDECARDYNNALRARSIAERELRELKKSIGNAAAMRETLELMNDLFDKGVICTSYANTAEETWQIEELYQKAKAALAQPPRNCNRYNSGDPVKDADDAYAEWQRQCEADDMPPSCKVESAFRQWLFAPAKSETKGESDASK